LAHTVTSVETQPIPLGIKARARRKVRSVLSHVLGIARQQTFPFRVRWLSGARSISATADEFIVVCLVRNGAIYLPEFLRHYRELGAKHIVLLDNISNDGTPELVAGESDVTVLSTAAPYKTHKDIMKRWLVTRFGRGNWVLCVDVDELFDYPFRAAIGATDLLRYLNQRGFTALVAQMLDLFPRGAITDVSNTNWRTEHRCYNLSDVEKESYAAFYNGANEVPAGDLELFRGGIRLSAFGAKPLLTKHPLLFPHPGLTYVNAHHVGGACIADLTAVLLHYKYAGDFVDYVRDIVERESFWNNSREYKQYLHAIEADPQLSLYSGTASELSSVEDLLERGFLVASDGFREEVEKRRRRN